MAEPEPVGEPLPPASPVDAEPSPPAPPAPRARWLTRLRSHPLGRMLPLAVLALIGAGLWQWDGLPQERTLAFRFSDQQRSARALEIQVSTEEGTLLQRSEWSFRPGDVPDEVSATVPLRQGAYQVRTFLRDARGLATGTQTLQVGHDARYSLPVALP